MTPSLFRQCSIFINFSFYFCFCCCIWTVMRLPMYNCFTTFTSRIRIGPSFDLMSISLFSSSKQYRNIAIHSLLQVKAFSNPLSFVSPSSLLKTVHSGLNLHSSTSTTSTSQSNLYEEVTAWLSKEEIPYQRFYIISQNNTNHHHDGTEIMYVGDNLSQEATSISNKRKTSSSSIFLALAKNPNAVVPPSSNASMDNHHTNDSRTELIHHGNYTLVLHLIPTLTNYDTTNDNRHSSNETLDLNTYSLRNKYLSNHFKNILQHPQNVYIQANDNNNHHHHLTSIQNVIHLHQDLWHTKKSIVQSRILTKIGITTKSTTTTSTTTHPHPKKWYARQTIVKRIPKNTTHQFLEQHHLWGSGGMLQSKFNYGLFDKNDLNNLVAVATFSSRRHVYRTLNPHLLSAASSSTTRTSSCSSSTKQNQVKSSIRPFRSHQLIQYCSKKDEHVIGGISKLLSAFVKEFAPDDIITCIDRDFGTGDGWETELGFVTVGILPPLVTVVDYKTLTRRYLIGNHNNSNSNSKNRHSSSNSDNANVEESPVVMGGSNKKDNDKDHNHNVKEREDVNISGKRPMIPSHILCQLEKVNTIQEALNVLHSNDLYPIYDAGVERRMLTITTCPNLAKVAKEKQKALGLEEFKLSPNLLDDDYNNIIDSNNSTVQNEAGSLRVVWSAEERRRVSQRLWKYSSVSFPDTYYSNNKGIQLLLDHAAENDRNIMNYNHSDVLC